MRKRYKEEDKWRRSHLPFIIQSLIHSTLLYFTPHSLSTLFSSSASPTNSFKMQFKTIFAVALLLFVITLVMNLLSQYVVSRFREEYE